MKTGSMNLFKILKDAGETILNDMDEAGNEFELHEIDPFSFYCYIYKYGPEKTPGKVKTNRKSI